MKQQLLILLLCSTALPAFAQSDVYLCIDSEGRREYKNTGSTVRCKRVELSGVVTVPSTPAVRQTSTASTPRPVMTSPTNFPKVNSAEQKARDSDRRQILMDEMKVEEVKLASLKRDYNNGEPERHGDERNYAKYQERTAAMKDDIARTERNIEALKRELGNLK